MNPEFDGAEYLRRLKQDHHNTQPQTSSGLKQKHPGWVERRAVPRYKCQGSAQVRLVNNDVRTWGSIADISLHGCYLEMATTYPAGTPVILNLELGGNRVEAKGDVRANYPFLGMGILFTDMTAQDRLRLADMVLMAARDLRLIVPHADDFASEWVMPQIQNPQRLLEALGNFFMRHSSLSRDDFTRIATSTSNQG